MSALQLLLAIDGALIALSLAAIVLASLGRPSYRFVYSAALALTAAGVVIALAFLLGREEPVSTSLPIGLPWIGAHFRLDALSAFFLGV